MTKEQIINKAIEFEFGSGNAKSIRESNSSLVKVAEHLYDLMMASLPSNLDEAELKYVEFSDYPPANQEEELMVYNAFKAGSEWMAGQGVSMQITDDTEWANVDSFVHKNVIGGSVIQIRNK